MRLVRLVVAIAASVPIFIVSFPALRWLDIHGLDEAAKDAWGRWMHREDWSTVPSLPSAQDYRWLHASRPPALVAHALGESGQPGQNSLAAMRRSLARGLRLLEVDLWLDRDGNLRCHHGPQAPPLLAPGDCVFEAALQLARESSAWLVLDIKTDFDRTGSAVVDRLPDDGSAGLVIFQLYRPDDVGAFSRWARRRPLAGPVMTAYLARRSLNHLAAQAGRLGVRALTVPLYRLPSLRVPPPAGISLFVHPVHDCDDARQAHGAAGWYVRSEIAALLRRGCIDEQP